MLNWEERRHLVKVATLYYEEGWTQEQIAKKMGVSRPVISKLLQKAKDVGIVEIYIKDQSVHSVQLEQKLESKFNLKDAVVVPTIGLTPDMAKRAVGQSAAYYVAKKIKDYKSLGISWGTTLAEMVKEFPYDRRDDMKIVPLEGGMGRKHAEIHANQLAYELAKKLNSNCLYLYAPAILDSVELKNRLLEMEDIKGVLEEGKKVDVAVIGIGNPHKGSTLKEIGYLEDSDVHILRQLGAVGDIGFRFFNDKGMPINDELNNKVIGVSLEELKKIPMVIAVVEGSHKADSVLGALEGKHLDVLITDEQTASALLMN